jgi:hypothetical protein
MIFSFDLLSVNTQLKEKTIFPKEELDQMCVGFVQYAFNEMQMHGWTERRSQSYEEQHIRHLESRQMDTFQNIMRTTYGEDMDNTLLHFFYNEITRRGWFASYCFQQRPELKEEEVNNNINYLSWLLDTQLKKWFLEDHDEGDFNYINIIEKIKNILGLDVCLK